MLTQSDVEERLVNIPHAFLPRGVAVVGAPPAVARLELITCAEVERLLNLSLAGAPGLGKESLVWFVELHGTFSPAGQSRPPGVRWDGTMYDVAYAVLDPTTGTTVLRGAGREKPATSPAT